MTAASATQSVYLPAIDGTRAAVEIRLDANCDVLEGRFRTGARLPENATARLLPLGEHLGFGFGAAVSADGEFKACIPAGNYFVYPPDGFAERNAVAVVPDPRAFEYRTGRLQEADRVDADVSGLTPESSEAFVASLPASTRVLGLAESNHGTREFYEERTELAVSLASKHGVRLLMIEAGYGEVLALDDYINGGKVDVARAVQELGYWMWDTNTFLKTLAELREYNAPLPPDKRIHIIGFDVQDTSGAIKYLERAGAAMLSANEIGRLRPFASDNGKAWKTATQNERAAIRAVLERIAAKRRSGSSSSKTNRVALAARSLVLRFDTLETSNEWLFNDARDAGMARMVLEVLALEPRSRATLWAHLGHLGREYVIGLQPMGAHLAAALGDAYRVYGLLAVGGSTRAWDYKREIGVVASSLSTPPAHSLEAVLDARSGGAPVTYWTFARATGEAARWLDGIRALRQFGAVFVPDGYDFTYWDLRSLDGAILFHSVTPTDPTPTGERRARPK